MATKILYWCDDNGQLYEADAVDLDDNGKAHGYTAFRVEDPVTLTAEQCCGPDGDILEILLSAGQATAV